MKRPGPLLTLLAGLLLGAFLLALDATTGRGNASSAYREESPSPTPAATTASPAPSRTRTTVTDGSYAGRTDDGSAAVALSVRDGRAIAYFCDGHDKESWLRGGVRDEGSMKLTGSHGAVLNGTVLGNQRVRGTVDVGDGRYAFTAVRAVKPSGLWRATATVRGARVDGGWIVLGDGRQVGLLDRDGKPSAAPRIDPATGAVTVDGQQLTARSVTP